MVVIIRGSDQTGAAVEFLLLGPLEVRVDGRLIDTGTPRQRTVLAALAEAAAAARPGIVVCRTSTVHGLDCLPPDADGHFIKLSPALAEAAIGELTTRLESMHA